VFCGQLIKERTHCHQCPTGDVINVVATIKISPNQSDECPSNINCNLLFLPFFKHFFCYDRLRPLHCQKRIAEWKRMQMLRWDGQEEKTLSPAEYSCGDRPQFQFWLNYSKIQFLILFFRFLFEEEAGIFWRMSASEQRNSAAATAAPPRSPRQKKDRGYCYLHFFRLHCLTSTRLPLVQLAEIPWARNYFSGSKILYQPK